MVAYKKNMVSIIMPAYNSERFISDAIESVLQQTHKNFELIIINDGSTDRTEDILKKYSSFIQYFNQSNQGASSARNIGILAAKGEYVAFLDSDDLWFKNTLKLQYEYLVSHPDVALVYGEMQLLDHTGTFDENYTNPKGLPRPEGYIFKDLILACRFGLSTVMVRRKVFNDIGLFETSLPLGEDYHLWLRISTKYKIGHIPDNLMKYRRHSNSLTSLNFSLKPWDLKVVEMALKMFPEEANKLPPLLLKKRFTETFFQSGYSAFMDGQYSIARYRFIKSISFLPGSWRSLLYLIASCCFPRFNHFMIKVIKCIFSNK